MKPTLLILAAGMGSRYGGLKQTDEFGPGGESIIDYSIYDAIRCGFGKVVFVIRKSFSDAFKSKFDQKLKGKIEVDYVYQELDDLPEGFGLPAEREKPWGTAHAVLVAKNKIKEPFAVINADDFYGKSSYQTIVDFFSGKNLSKNYCVVGYRMENTLSPHGTVSRAICNTDTDGNLTFIEERLNIGWKENGKIESETEGKIDQYNGKELVSMNMMGFTPDIFPLIDHYFQEFLSENLKSPKKEFYIPTVLEKIISSGQGKIKVLTSEEIWFGVTYPEDKPKVMENIKQLIDQGIYPPKLWK
jgi:dTDP-glucose pyrophosphorylase